ncbi:MAG: hypothetical protein ACXWHD_12785, partial [Candidatus Aminicenantales bacterium]
MTRKTRVFFLALPVIVSFALVPQAKIMAGGAGRPDSAVGPLVDVVKRVPAVEDLMALKSAGNPQISPDGRRVAYTVTETDFDQDAYVTQIWLADVASGET